jgi:hypothetical protein
MEHIPRLRRSGEELFKQGYRRPPTIECKVKNNELNCAVSLRASRGA